MKTELSELKEKEMELWSENIEENQMHLEIECVK
jgi:hypothetical protein